MGSCPQRHRRLLVALSGPLSAGKTTLAERFRRDRQALVVSARQILIGRGGSATDRSELQRRGAELEAQTHGSWLVEPVLDALKSADNRLVIVDSVRTVAQAQSIKQKVPETILIHLTASEVELSRRFGAGLASGNESSPDVRNHPTETHAKKVARYAVLVIDTTDLAPASVFERVASFLDQLSAADR